MITISRLSVPRKGPGIGIRFSGGVVVFRACLSCIYIYHIFGSTVSLYWSRALSILSLQACVRLNFYVICELIMLKHTISRAIITQYLYVYSILHECFRSLSLGHSERYILLNHLLCMPYSDVSDQSTKCCWSSYFSCI